MTGAQPSTQKDLKSLAVVDVIIMGEKQLEKSAFRKSGTTITNELDTTYTFGSSVTVTMDNKGTLKNFTPLFIGKQYITGDKEQGSFATFNLENALRVFSNNSGHITHNEFFTDNKATFRYPYVDNSTVAPYLLPATMRTVKNYGMVYYITHYGSRYWLNKMTW